MKYISKSEKETNIFAEAIADKLKGGEIIGLIGRLGAGKTTFTKAIAKALKITKHITSPTFVLMKVYSAKHKTVKKLVHIDAYRLKTAGDLSAIGAEEYFNRPDSVIIIEWADRIKSILPKKTAYYIFKLTGENSREIKKG